MLPWKLYNGDNQGICCFTYGYEINCVGGVTKILSSISLVYDFILLNSVKSLFIIQGYASWERAEVGK